MLALEEMAGLRERPGLSVNVQTSIAGPQLVGYAYEPCNRQVSLSPTIEAEPVPDRPVPDTMLALIVAMSARRKQRLRPSEMRPTGADEPDL